MSVSLYASKHVRVRMHVMARARMSASVNTCTCMWVARCASKQCLQPIEFIVRQSLPTHVYFMHVKPTCTQADKYLQPNTRASASTRLGKQQTADIDHPYIIQYVTQYYRNTVLQAIYQFGCTLLPKNNDKHHILHETWGWPEPYRHTKSNLVHEVFPNKVPKLQHMYMVLTNP